MHFQHLSTAGSVELVRAAKARGLRVTAEATTHHFTLTHAEVATYDPVFKVNPPLRTDADVAAIRAGLADGTIDAIATDHAPHTQQDKEAPFDQAPSGHARPRDGAGPRASPSSTCRSSGSLGPAVVAAGRHRRADAGARRAPSPRVASANLCVIDPTVEWVVDPAAGASRSRNTPYAGRSLTGRVRHTIVFGEPVVLDGEVQR